MRYLNKLLCLFILCVSTNLYSQYLIGSWEHTEINSNGDTIKSIVSFTDGFQSLCVFNATEGAFIHTNGGAWSLENDRLTEKVEYHSDSSNYVGQEITFKIILTDSTLQIAGEDEVFKRLDDGTPGDLNGAWLMSGRKRNGEIQQRDTDKPRKTMKILSGTRFQWIAYNTETKQFLATGGGTYTTDNGEYIENIEFFSRDDSRSGASLKFNYELKNDDWHHSGLSSKGDPIYEIWTRRQ
ncbi:hypothetical protein [Marivirga arenosa]|uniref:Membrane or secreted protein n=1 Tax=Marivirga arenosa TaxID=3059076 RepID=A0AA51ZWM9_9BACT|nr:hypothetical protein [Marivirga sp. BKB1-2]WNB18168.1 hypothetical protein QYS47_29405 [Marivirga sp. BKB1-2]